MSLPSSAKQQTRGGRHGHGRSADRQSHWKRRDRKHGCVRARRAEIERVTIDKISGTVSYAVLSFGDLLGIGDDHYPLPWQPLKYDTNLGGYVTGITQDQLRGAPKYDGENS